MSNVINLITDNFIFRFLISCLICIISFGVFHGLYKPLHNDATPEISTSVWCLSDKSNDKRCTFKKLCYNQNNSFLFILTKNSIISGIHDKDGLKKIKVSSVLDHNGMYMRLSIIFSNNTILKNPKIIRRPIFLLWRFKPDNIMHVLHDDLLPLFVSYSQLCLGNVQKCASKYFLVFTDGVNEGRFNELYTIFSSKNPTNLANLSEDKTVCFEDVIVGLSTESVFFQYGFKSPQGPVKSVLSGAVLSDFSDFILNKFSLKKIDVSEAANKCSFITRSLNRKILNENYIVSYLKKVTSQGNKSILVERVDLLTNSITEILFTITGSKIMIGMHGAAMILSMFLPKGASVLELFPFAISPEIVSPVYSMSKLLGIHFSYSSWCNRNESNSFPHPEYPVLWGGIEHLSADEQNVIKSVKKVPAVKCCHNPIYLYRMYQDTIVDESITFALDKIVFDQLSNYTEFDFLFFLQKEWYFPGPINELQCRFSKGNLVSISWNQPINVEKLDFKYIITYIDNGVVSLISTESNFIQLEVKQDNEVEFWIYCLANRRESVVSYVLCQR